MPLLTFSKDWWLIYFRGNLVPKSLWMTFWCMGNRLRNMTLIWNKFWIPSKVLDSSWVNRNANSARKSLDILVIAWVKMALNPTLKNWEPSSSYPLQPVCLNYGDCWVWSTTWEVFARSVNGITVSVRSFKRKFHMGLGPVPSRILREGEASDIFCSCASVLRPESQDGSQFWSCQ
jgi:hypothetical protein